MQNVHRWRDSRNSLKMSLSLYCVFLISPPQHNDLILQVKVSFVFLFNALHGEKLSSFPLLHHEDLRERPPGEQKIEKVEWSITGLYLRICESMIQGLCNGSKAGFNEGCDLLNPAETSTPHQQQTTFEK